jgi:hypothetical protein
MNQAFEHTLKVTPDAGSRIEKLVELIDELISVVAEENAWLAQGLPASRSKQIARKVELSDLLKVWVDEITSQEVSIRTSDERLRSMFKERMDLLKVNMDENIVRLRAAIESSRRRIETVMSAIREQVLSSSPYTPAGRANGHVTTLGTNIRA